MTITPPPATLDQTHTEVVTLDLILMEVGIPVVTTMGAAGITTRTITSWQICWSCMML